MGQAGPAPTTLPMATLANPPMGQVGPAPRTLPMATFDDPATPSASVDLEEDEMDEQNADEGGGLFLSEDECEEEAGEDESYGVPYSHNLAIKTFAADGSHTTRALVTPPRPNMIKYWIENRVLAKTTCYRPDVSLKPDMDPAPLVELLQHYGSIPFSEVIKLLEIKGITSEPARRLLSNFNTRTKAKDLILWASTMLRLQMRSLGMILPQRPLNK
ncbi:hypothetical protein OC835_006401 [Tilletia horrida]|nr:hypothetical protein OC835_006401 [Tilletia horrida]